MYALRETLMYPPKVLEGSTTGLDAPALRNTTRTPGRQEKLEAASGSVCYLEAATSAVMAAALSAAAAP